MARRGKGTPKVPHPDAWFYQDVHCGGYMMVLMGYEHAYPHGDQLVRRAVANTMCVDRPMVSATMVKDRIRMNERQFKPVKWKDLPAEWKLAFEASSELWGESGSLRGFGRKWKRWGNL